MSSSRRLLGPRCVAALALTPLVMAACGNGQQATSDDMPVPAGSGTRTAPVPEAGDAAGGPDFAQVLASAPALDGSAVDAAALARGDTVAWFWAPWCTSCRAEAPDISEVAERYDGQVHMIGVAGRGELDAMRDFVADTGTGALTHLADVDGTIWSAFGIYAQPAFAFIDDTGEVEVFVGGLDAYALAARVDQLLRT